MIETEQEYQDKFRELIYRDNGKDVLLKPYWVSEWSWKPMSDGHDAYLEQIRFKKEVNGIMLYFTGRNHRAYLPYQLHETKEAAKEMCMWMDHEGYQGAIWRQEVLASELGDTFSVTDQFNRELLQEQLDKYGYFEW